MQNQTRSGELPRGNINMMKAPMTLMNIEHDVNKDLVVE